MRPVDQRISAALTCSDIPQDPPKSVVVRGDCHAVRHTPAHMTIMTVDGNCRVNATPSLVPLVSPGAGAVAVPIQTVLFRTTTTPSITLQVRPPQLIARVTLASLPSKAIADGARPVDQSRLPSSFRAPIIQRAPADATTHRPRPAIMAVLPLGLRCHDRLGGLIHEFAQVASHE
jgi:hypothetical protein